MNLKHVKSLAELMELNRFLEEQLERLDETERSADSRLAQALAEVQALLAAGLDSLGSDEPEAPVKKPAATKPAASRPAMMKPAAPKQIKRRRVLPPKKDPRSLPYVDLILDYDHELRCMYASGAPTRR